MGTNEYRFNNVGCVLRTISISANSHVMVHGMHPTGRLLC